MSRGKIALPVLLAASLALVAPALAETGPKTSAKGTIAAVEAQAVTLTLQSPSESGKAPSALRLLEGLDGAGTTTQSGLLGARLRAGGRRVHVTAEPSGGPVGTLRRNFWAASGTIVSGPGTIYLFAGYAGNGRAPAPVRVGGLASGPDTSAWQYEASYPYSLSSRTMAYAGYVRIDNEANAAYNFYVNPFTPQSAAGLRLSGYVLGMAHFF